MSTWHLLPDSSRDGFRWEVTGRILQSDPDSTPNKVIDSTAPLHSMADLLLQGYSKVIERDEAISMFRTGLGNSVPLKGHSVAKSVLTDDMSAYSDLQNKNSSNPQISEVDTTGTLPMFRMDLGKPAPLKQSSIPKAPSIVEGDYMMDSDNVLPRESEFGVPNTFFQTASNKKVNISSAGLARAKALLGLEIDYLNEFAHMNQSSSSHQQHGWSGSKTHEEFEDYVSGKRSEILNKTLKVSPTTFQTAHGKSLSVSAEALKRARNLLGDPELGTSFDDAAAGDQFFTPQKDETHVNQSSSSHQQHGWSGSKTHEEFEDYVSGKRSEILNKTLKVAPTTFQTAHGKSLSVSAEALKRARNLLGDPELGTFFDDSAVGDQFFTPQKDEMHVNQSSSSHQQHGWSGSKTHEEFEDYVSGKRSEILNKTLKVAPTTFQTAHGKSLSVSAEALKRARNLFGDPELGTSFDDAAAVDQFFTPEKDEKLGDIAINNGSANTLYTARKEKTNNIRMSNSFVSPLLSSSKQFRSVKLGNLVSGGNLTKKFDAAVDETDCALNTTKHATYGIPNNRPLASDMAVNNSKENVFIPRAKQFRRPADQPLANLTNCSDTAYTKRKQDITQKKRLGKTVSVSPFKRPRITSFKTPLKKNFLNASGLFVVSSDTLNSKKVFSTRFPERSTRVYSKDYFGMHPAVTTEMDYVPDHVRRIKSSNADKYVFRDESSSDTVGAESFLQMLAEAGASLQHASRKWIVWKLACYEIYYPAKCRGNFLTITNVLEELKYRYEREFNHGHCSTIKRILSGAAPASSMMVLCISAINIQTVNDSQETHGSESCSNVKVELTDGWYSMNAALDVVLTKQLNAGKLFVGQKLRILGARLSGWATPTSPLEAVVSSTICLMLNINGTYRAHWADRLGFCKEVGVPLAFNCIKCNGGPVPKTLAGITRIYPVLYKERLGEKKSTVRSERMENRIIQLHNQRRSALVEGLMCEYQRGINDVYSQNDTDSEEGAKVLKLLETAAEPELLMAEMSREQLTSFTTYKAKYEAAKQMQMEKSVAKALEDAGLGERNVTPFMRIRIVGLTSLSYEGEQNQKEGIVTIWNPTERQITELTEGKIYIMRGLVPMNSDSETLYLHARGSSSRWQPLSHKVSETFQPFFNPRKPISLSNLSEIPLSSEFDLAAYVVYVGDAYTDVKQKKQWVFVTDGSGEISNSLLAISFSTADVDDLSVPHISSNLVGSVVGFCNLIKRAKDAKNEMWVGEATENSDYFINAEANYAAHLRTNSARVQTWAKSSSSKFVIRELRRRVLFIIGASESQPSC